MSRSDIVKKISDKGAIAVIRLKEGNKFNKVTDAIFKGGVVTVELTMTTPDAFNVLENAVKECNNEIVFGMGSVLNAADAQRAIDSGADFIVSPIFKTELIETAHKNDKPAKPGCFSPSEIQNAYEAGADIIKIFPADVLGMIFFKGIKAPLPHLRLMPTGGVTLTNGGDWLRAGACVVGIGSALIDNEAVEEENYSLLTENARILMQSIASAREIRFLEII